MGFLVFGLGFGVWDLGFRVLGFMVYGLQQRITITGHDIEEIDPLRFAKTACIRDFMWLLERLRTQARLKRANYTWSLYIQGSGFP